jgi:hypothetical protein
VEQSLICQKIPRGCFCAFKDPSWIARRHSLQLQARFSDKGANELQVSGRIGLGISDARRSIRDQSGPPLNLGGDLLRTRLDEIGVDFKCNAI